MTTIRLGEAQAEMKRQLNHCIMKKLLVLTSNGAPCSLCCGDSVEEEDIVGSVPFFVAAPLSNETISVGEASEDWVFKEAGVSVDSLAPEISRNCIRDILTASVVPAIRLVRGINPSVRSNSCGAGSSALFWVIRAIVPLLLAEPLVEPALVVT